MIAQSGLDIFFSDPLGAHSGGSRSTKDGLSSVSQLDGLLLGCLLSPRLVPASVYLPMIWNASEDESQPEWASLEEMQRFMTALMNWHNKIAGDLHENICNPLTLVAEDRTEFHTDWALGFLLGCTTWEDDSDECLEIRKQITGGLLELLRLDTEDETTPKEIEDTFAQIMKAVGEAQSYQQSSIDFGSSRDTPFPYDTLAPIHREAPKVGSNDPCPCGSGQKYKRCCMN